MTSKDIDKYKQFINVNSSRKFFLKQKPDDKPIHPVSKYCALFSALDVSRLKALPRLTRYAKSWTKKQILRERTCMMKPGALGRL